MYQISPMNWILILFLVSFLIMNMYSLMNIFEKKSFYFNFMVKIYVK